MGVFHGYARISTKDQSSHSLNNQIEYLKVQASNLKLDFEGYREEQSGKDAKRPVLQSIIRVLQEGDVLGVYDNSRLGRDTAENLKIAEEINSRGAKLQVNGKILNLNDPNDELQLTIESAVSTYQRKNQNLKSRIGIDAVKASGEWVFTSRMYGYTNKGNKRKPDIQVVEQEANVIQFIFDEYSKGRSFVWITNELNRRGFKTKDGGKWYYATIRRYIHKPIYMGYYKVKAAGGAKGQEKVEINKDDLVQSKHYPPIISEELFWETQRSYRKVKRTHALQFERRYSGYPLTSVIRCGYCGNAYYHMYNKRVSGHNSEYYASMHCEPGCPQSRKTFIAHIIEDLMKQIYLFGFIHFKEDIQDYIESLSIDLKQTEEERQEDLERINKQIRSLETKIANQMKAIDAGLNIERAVETINKYEAEIIDLKESKHTVQVSLVDTQDEIESIIKDYMQDSIARFRNGSVEERRAMMMNMFTATVKDTYLHIEYKHRVMLDIDLYRNTRWDIQKEFPIKITRRNKDPETGEYSVVGDSSLNKFGMSLEVK